MKPKQRQILRRHRCQTCQTIYVCERCSRAMNRATADNWPLYHEGCNNYRTFWECPDCKQGRRKSA